jgi:hypothetical protein
MKVEIRKETRFDGVWYWTYIDGILDHCYSDLDRAKERYNVIVADGKKPPVWETIKSEEI